MINASRLSSAALACLVFVARFGFAQPLPPSPHVTLQYGQYPAAYAKPFEEVIIQLDAAKLRQPSPIGLETTLLDAAKKVAGYTLRRNLVQFIGTHTFTTAGRDVLVALWRDPGRAPQERGIWLYDTTFMTDLIIQVDPVLLSPNLLPGYLEDLIVWERPPVRAKALRLSFSESSGQRWVFGSGDHTQQERGMFQWRITGMANSRDGYIRVAVSKPFFGDLYPREAGVPERFPPLSTRIANSSKADLLLELGKGFDVTQRYARYPSDRDEIVVSQILAKGQLTDAEIQQVVVGQFDQVAFSSAVNDRLGAFLHAAQKRGLLSQYLPALERLFLTARRQGGLHDVAAQRMLGFMGRNGIDATGTAVALVERNQFVRPSLIHLQIHGRSEEVLKRLSAANVGPEFAKEKQNAIDRIGARLKSAGKP